MPPLLRYREPYGEKGVVGYYPAAPLLFNLNPEAFGLSYGIFEEEIVVYLINGIPTTITTADWASQASITHYPPVSAPSSIFNTTRRSHLERRVAAGRHRVAKRDETIAPSGCYSICNNAYYSGQAIGKSDELCADDSKFTEQYGRCMECISGNGLDYFSEYLAAKFKQFRSWCPDLWVTWPKQPEPAGRVADLFLGYGCNSLRHRWRNGLWFPHPQL